MGDHLVDTKVDPLAIEGFDAFFKEDGPENIPEQIRTFLDETKDSSSSVQEGPTQLVHPISVEEAATILKISTNAICKRLRKGNLTGKKIPGKFKDEWLVEGAGLIEVLDVDIKQAQDCPEESVDYGSVQDHTVENFRKVQDGPVESTSRLIDLVEKQAAKLEAAAGQIGYLQAQLESQARLLETTESRIKLLTDTQSKQSPWARLRNWFIGANT